MRTWIIIAILLLAAVAFGAEPTISELEWEKKYIEAEMRLYQVQFENAMKNIPEYQKLLARYKVITDAIEKGKPGEKK